ncbi:MAG: nuclear transport factor 2 family protein [Actinomycetes bacterium]|jgi:ketosteroid isomerase-like protein
MNPADEVAIIHLYADYNRTIDEGDIEGWLATWATDGTFELPSRAFNGHAELRGFGERRISSLPSQPVGSQRHWNAEVQVSGDGDGDGDSASGSCLLMVAGQDRSSGTWVVVARGRYIDELTKVDGRWAFRRRTAVLD